MSCNPTSKHNFKDLDELQDIDALCPDNACGIFRAQAQRSRYDLRRIAQRNHNLKNCPENSNYMSLANAIPDTYVTNFMEETAPKDIDGTYCHLTKWGYVSQPFHHLQGGCPDNSNFFAYCNNKCAKSNEVNAKCMSNCLNLKNNSS